jgi:uncharacterized protein (UPF0333 family)
MNWSVILLLVVLIVINYYYIDQFNKTQKDIKAIKLYIEEKKKS